MCHVLGNGFSLSPPPSALVKMSVVYFYLKAEPLGSSLREGQEAYPGVTSG